MSTRFTVYADKPIKRECACTVPIPQREDDGDVTCFRCGRPLERGEAKATIE